jgi:CRISP-associated protein Cas1
MPTLYVQEQGSKVQKRDHEVLVTKDGEVLQALPVAHIDQVVLMGRGVQMTTAALVDLLLKDIPILITNQQGSKLYVSLTRGVSRFVELRTQQMYLVHTPDRALELARAMVLAKLHNQRALLARTGWASAAAAIAQIGQQMRSLRRQRRSIWSEATRARRRQPILARGSWPYHQLALWRTGLLPAA